MDLISRQMAIDALEWTWAGKAAFDAIKNLPSAQKWIPVSESVPKNDDWVIVTILDEWGDTPWTYTDFGWYLEAANCWIIDAVQRTDVIAWMPLPQPWEGEKDE